MPKYVIEREIPNAGKLTQQELQAISQKSCGVLQKLGPQVQWLESNFRNTDGDRSNHGGRLNSGHDVPFTRAYDRGL
jgi:hypothetical protein